ncbi:hypothetical protein NMY22_g7302 [Coprinellus aureogranulatus]|nr:hypothetical protein NMY22_g7302 [Coprinellus aureogranulatus]
MGGDSEDEYLWLQNKQWEMMKEMGIEPTGGRPSMKRRQVRPEPRPDSFTFSTNERRPSARTGALIGAAPCSPASQPPSIRKSRVSRQPAPFPMNLFEAEDHTHTLKDELPPIPQSKVVVNPDAGWKPRTMQEIIEEGKKRKVEEGGDMWDSEDEMLCMRREQWKMMRALGIETEEAEPKSKWRRLGGTPPQKIHVPGRSLVRTVAQPAPLSSNQGGARTCDAGVPSTFSRRCGTQGAINSSPGSGRKGLQLAIGAAKKRKRDEKGNSGWDSEDEVEVLCMWEEMSAEPDPTREASPVRNAPPRRKPAPFPLDLAESDYDDGIPLAEPLPPIPDRKIVVDDTAGWERRSLAEAIEAGKKRKRDEGADDGWGSDDELLCIRREQWRMMRALGMETQETEPMPRWRPRART